MCPRTVLDGCGKFRPNWFSVPRPSSPSQVPIPTELSRPTVWLVVHSSNVKGERYGFMYHEAAKFTWTYFMSKGLNDFVIFNLLVSKL